ncbi:metallopeptidase family protein [Corynebacterium riegelii]|uniref:metallopeptidase family protein n=1 Tax=Corynebacterium riegelii TaxID=156976 RepID=UPI00191E48D4|nr:metallopeptidase family protein [Corynebacterium riegelii]QQU85014.1 metallopeptidase family protein [Corynebacterium riegelii]
MTTRNSPSHLRPGRDRHGRGVRGPVLPVGVPRYRSRSQAFDQLVLEMYAPLHNAYFDQLSGVDLAVDTIPRMRLRADMTVLPDEIVADGPVPLGRVLEAGVDRDGNPTRARFVIFRRPIEQRTTGTEERSELITWVLTALVAYYLNLDPRDVDPDFPW